MTQWMTEHMLITYLAIVICIIFIYNKVFRVRKLPILKELIVYFLIALGSVMLLIFQIDASLPILQSLLIAILMMAVYRVRMLYLSRSKKNEDSKQSEHEG